MLRAVFVDWFGTISSSRFFEHWSAPDHPRRSAFDALQDWWFDPASQPFLNDWLTGSRTVDDFLALTSERWDLPLEEARAELLESFRHWTLLEPETRSLLAALRGRGVRTVLATDNVDACIRWAVPALGLQESFDDVLSSHELGVGKGEPGGRFFRPYLEAHGIGPGESVLIDDSESIRNAVEACGIRFLHASRGTGPGMHLRKLLEAHSGG